MWNGTAAILKAKPTMSRPTAMSSIGLPDIDCAAMAAPAGSRWVVPVTP